MTSAIVGTLVFIGLLAWLTRNLPKIPFPETEDELREQGLTSIEAKREARAQRSEHRAMSRTQSEVVRSAASAARLSRKLIKDFTK